MIYFTVNELAPAVARARELGATTVGERVELGADRGCYQDMVAPFPSGRKIKPRPIRSRVDPAARVRYHQRAADGRVGRLCEARRAGAAALAGPVISTVMLYLQVSFLRAALLIR